MDRLTNESWRNLDPWECCGQDYFCTRGCHDSGGCTGGCIVPKLYARLGEYEDTGLSPEAISDLLERFHSLYEIFDDLDLVDRVHFQAFLERVRRWHQAKKDGRLVVLPPVSESASAFQKNLDVFELSLAIKWAHAAALMDEKPEVSHLFSLSEIALNEKLERLVNGQSPSDQLTREEAEAALKKAEPGHDG